MLQPWIYPLPIGLLLVVAGALLLWHRWRIAGGTLVAVAVIGLYLLSTPVVATALAGELERRFGPVAVGELPRADAIVILGGGVSPPARPRAAADLGRSFDRVWFGARLFRAGLAPLVITTGARPYADDGVSAAVATRELLQQLGVPRTAVETRGDSRSTREDALAVSAELERRGLEDVLLVTSALHMPRALAAFHALNVQVWPAPTDHEVIAAGRSGTWSWLPYPWAFALTNRAWHEYVGMLYYRLRGWI